MKASLIYRLPIKLTFLAVLALIVCFAVSATDSNAAEKKSAKKIVSNDAGAINQNIDPDDPNSVLYSDTAGKKAGMGDGKQTASIVLRNAMGWHPKALSATGLPLDRYGLVDWAKIVREGKIKPRHSLDPNEEEMPPLPLDVLIEAKSDFVADVIYPHEIHTWWLKCEVCHPKIFIPAKGENHMTMAGIAKGEWCGRCHGKVAFPLTDCIRCHTSPKPKKK